MSRFSTSQVFWIMRFLVNLANATMFTNYAVYYIAMLGLNPFQLLMVGTVLEVTVLLLEGVTGVVADTYSRRLSVIVGMFVIGAAYVLEGSVPWIGSGMSGLVSLFVLILISEAIRGVGETFISGADSAWIVDEVGESNVGRVFLKASRLGLVAQLLGIGLSVGLASIAPNIPYVVGGVLYLAVAVFVLLFMKETKFKPQPKSADHSPLKSMFDTWKGGIKLVRGRSVLWMILLVTVFSGAASEGYDRLWEAHLLSDLSFPAFGGFSAVAWFGIISVIGTLVSMIAVRIAESKLNMEEERAVALSMFVLTVLRIATTVSFALAPNFLWALVSLMAVSVVRTLSDPIYTTWLNQHVESKVRATVLSMMSQSDALGQTVGGPFVGLVGNRFSIRASITLAALLLSPILVVFARVIRKKEM